MRSSWLLVILASLVVCGTSSAQSGNFGAIVLEDKTLSATLFTESVEELQGTKDRTDLRSLYGENDEPLWNGGFLRRHVFFRGESSISDTSNSDELRFAIWIGEVMEKLKQQATNAALQDVQHFVIVTAGSRFANQSSFYDLVSTYTRAEVQFVSAEHLEHYRRLSTFPRGPETVGIIDSSSSGMSFSCVGMDRSITEAGYIRTHDFELESKYGLSLRTRVGCDSHIARFFCTGRGARDFLTLQKTAECNKPKN